jgi:phosphoglycolate phosphatase
MQNIQNLLWDFNGTIIDDARLCCEAYNYVFGLHGKSPITQELLAKIWNLPVRSFFEHFEFENLDEIIDRLCEEFHDFYAARWHACSIQPGVQQLLAFAHQRALGQAVLSGHPHDYLVEMLEHFDLHSQFQAVQGVNTIVAVDKIEVGRDLMAMLKWRPEHTLIVGDSTFDFETAKALGIGCVLVARGIQSRERLEACGSPVFDSISEFLRALEQSNE